MAKNKRTGFQMLAATSTHQCGRHCPTVGNNSACYCNLECCAEHRNAPAFIHANPSSLLNSFPTQSPSPFAPVTALYLSPTIIPTTQISFSRPLFRIAKQHTKQAPSTGHCWRKLGHFETVIQLCAVPSPALFWTWIYLLLTVNM